MWVYERLYSPEDLRKLSDYCHGFADYVHSMGCDSMEFVSKAGEMDRMLAENPYGVWRVLVQSDGDDDLRLFRRNVTKIRKALGPGSYRFRKV